MHRFLLGLACCTFLFATWTPSDFPFATVADVAAHPTIAGLAFALTASGIFRTSDGGGHWDRVSDLGLYTFSFVPVHALAFNPFDDRELCALGDSSLSCTTDLGATWAVLPKPGLTFLLFDSTVRDRIYMGTPYGNDWVYVSSDHGRSWSARGSFDVHPWFHGSAAVDRGSGALLETGSPHGGCTPVCSIFRSDDAGSSWREIVAEEEAWTLASDRFGRSVLYVFSSGTLRASSDLGGRFEFRGSSPVAVHGLASDPNNVSTVYAGGDAGVVLQSFNGGRSWTRIDESEIRDSNGSPSRVVHVSVGSDGTVYVATDVRVFARSAGKRRRAAFH